MNTFLKVSIIGGLVLTLAVLFSASIIPASVHADQDDQAGNVACSNNAECGTNALTGSSFCQGNDVYRNQLTYYCNNAGTIQSFCSNALVPQLTTACGTNNTCNSGSCTNKGIACGSNADCGFNGLTGSPFCQGNNIYRNYKINACNNPGTSQSFCSSSLTPQLTQTCSPNQNCANGACMSFQITCSSDSQCGTNALTGGLFCRNNSIFQNYITYTCNNPGTSSSRCVNSTTAQLQSACDVNQTCSNGSCVNLNITCSDDSQCGTDGPTGAIFCQGSSVYQNYKTYTCNNPGTPSSRCSNSTTAQVQTVCTSNQRCSNGSCIDLNIACSDDSQCGISGSTGAAFCQGNSVYQNYRTYICNNPGTPSSRCSNSTAAQLQNTCDNNQRCSNGSCTNTCTSNSYQNCVGNSLYWYNSCGVQQSLIRYCPNGCSGDSCQDNPINTCTYHSYERCSGNNLYWYDSCGIQQDLVQYCPNGCSGNTCQIINNVTSTLTVSKTVKNLTRNSGFSNSTYASPSDMLMFMITLQASGNQDIQNVFVRDSLPANLIYNNQLIVACNGNNSNCNSSGSIISGINLNTIYAGQTVTITYQVQVAGAQSFAFGTTTLNNSVSVTSSQAGNAPTSSASVVVTRAGVLGASTVSTGLTNNFWVDSFFLPLLITLIILGMWRTGMFFWVEKWLDDRKKVRRGYLAQRELSKRIAKIHKVEKA